MTALSALAFADNFADEAVKNGDSMTVSDKTVGESKRNTHEQMTATSSEIKDAASSVENIKPVPVKNVKIVKSDIKQAKSIKKTKKIVKKHAKTKKIAKKHTKKSHKKIAKKSHKKTSKKA